MSSFERVAVVMVSPHSNRTLTKTEANTINKDNLTEVSVLFCGLLKNALEEKQHLKMAQQVKKRPLLPGLIT